MRTELSVKSSNLQNTNFAFDTNEQATNAPWNEKSLESFISSPSINHRYFFISPMEDVLMGFSSFFGSLFIAQINDFTSRLQIEFHLMYSHRDFICTGCAFKKTCTLTVRQALLQLKKRGNFLFN